MWYGVQNMSKYDIDIKVQPLKMVIVVGSWRMMEGWWWGWWWDGGEVEGEGDWDSGEHCYQDGCEVEWLLLYEEFCKRTDGQTNRWTLVIVMSLLQLKGTKSFLFDEPQIQNVTEYKPPFTFIQSFLFMKNIRLRRLLFLKKFLIFPPKWIKRFITLRP